MTLRQFLRPIVPPIVVDWWRHTTGGGIQFVGPYASWEEAARHAHGYGSSSILETVQAATRAVINGTSAAERDSVLFERVPYPFPLIAILLRAACENRGALAVLDFGGALGSSYYQCRDFLNSLNHVTWSIVEQPAFVACGRAEFEQGPIRFYDSIASAASVVKPTVVLLSGVLQYIREPRAVLEEIQKLGSRYVLIDRTPLAANGKQAIAVQRVPQDIHRASYPAWLFAEEYLKSPFQADYEQIADFDAVDGTLGHAPLAACFRGYVFRRKDNNRD